MQCMLLGRRVLAAGLCSRGSRAADLSAEMPPKGRGRGRGRGRGKAGRGGGGGRAHSSSSNQARTNPPAADKRQPKKQRTEPAAEPKAPQLQPRGKAKAAGGGAGVKQNVPTPKSGETTAASETEAEPKVLAQASRKAEPAAARKSPREVSALRTHAPSTPAPTTSGDRAARIDSALKQILASPSPQRLTAAATAAASLASSAGSEQCRQWSRDEYFSRVKTFKPSYWFAPASQLSPMVCARFGWVCVGTDTLACRNCEHQISYRAPVSDSDEEWTATVDAFTRQLSAAHKPQCPWRKEACPSGFLEFPPSSGGKLFASFTSRLRDLLRYQNEGSWLPRVQSMDKLAPGGELEELTVENSAPRNLAALAGFPNSGSAAAHAACMLALFGWTLRISSAQHGPASSSPLSPTGPGGDCNGVLQCDLCGRTCGVWNFTALSQPKKQQQVVTGQKCRPDKLRRTCPPSTISGGRTSSFPIAFEAPVTPQTVDMISCYKRCRHPSLGGFEPQLVGQYVVSRPDTQPQSAQCSSHSWSGHFVAEAMLWSTPLRVAGQSGPNKRQWQQQSRHGGVVGAPTPSDDSDMNDDDDGNLEDGAEGDTTGECFDPRVEHRSFCPWVGRDGGSTTSMFHPGWRQTRTVVLMEIKKRQRSGLPFSAVAGSSATLTGEGDEAAARSVAGAQTDLDTQSVWVALRRSLHAVR